MKNIVDIKNRIKSVKDIAQITRAMELISVAKMRKADERREHHDRYYRRINSVIKDIFAHSPSIDHPYLKPAEGKGTVFIVIASDAGLAGGYNNRVLQLAEKEIAAAGSYKVFTVGYMAEEYLSVRGYATIDKFVYCSQNPTLDDIRRLAMSAIDYFDSGEADEIKIISTRTIKGHNTAISTRLLPLGKGDFEDAKPLADYKQILHFEPSAADVFNILAPQYVFGTMFNALAEAIRCEHSERMAAMGTATENAGQMIEKLEREYHRARQEKITSELAETSSSLRE